jgi:hypothetical protein
MFDATQNSVALRARANRGPTAMAVLAAPTSRGRLPGPLFRHQIHDAKGVQFGSVPVCQRMSGAQLLFAKSGRNIRDIS